MSGGDGGPRAGLKIGRTLELARLERGLSLSEIEEATKIRAAYLRALEEEDFDVLPAVYVQGSLKTYANFLHLDGEALVRELKRRRPPQERPPYPLYVGPREEDSLDDILAAAGGEPESRDEDRERAGPAPLPAGGYLYLVSAVFLVLAVAAAALALNAAGEGRQQAVSQVREPLVSRAPETSPPDAREDASGQRPQQESRQDDGQGGTDEKDEDEKDEPKPANSAAEDAEVAEQTPQSSASATASASPAAETASPERDARTAAAEPNRRSSAGTRASAPASQVAAAPAASPRPAGQPGGAPQGGGQSAPPRGGGELQVEVNVGAEDPVQLSGGPFD
jgi:cytoskeletal protein RodZ